MGLVGLHTLNSLSLFKKLLFSKVTGRLNLFFVLDPNRYTERIHQITMPPVKNLGEIFCEDLQKMLIHLEDEHQYNDEINQIQDLKSYAKLDNSTSCLCNVLLILQKMQKYLKALTPTIKLQRQSCEVQIF